MLVRGGGIPWCLCIGARFSSTHPSGQRDCCRPGQLHYWWTLNATAGPWIAGSYRKGQRRESSASIRAQAPLWANSRASLELKTVDKSFGSVKAMQTQFNQAAAGRFGSVWAWMIQKPDGSLAITSTTNQDNPVKLLPGIERDTLLLGLEA